MASVFRAVVDGPRGFAHSVVIKRILPEYSANASFVNMLASEARLCGLLRHPGIVQVHEFGEVQGEYYLAMELVEGADLLDVVRTCHDRGKRLSPGLVCHIIRELAGALAYAHALTDEDGQPLDIVHRDVSPSNIMLTRLGTVKLLDFGIAKAATHMREENTHTGTIKGKFSYMSPEQADGRDIDRRSDIFALGIVFHECLTGVRLFQGDNDLERLRLVREAQVPRPSPLFGDIDSEVEAVVIKMLARDPAQRYACCDEVVAALTPIVHRLNADARALQSFLAELGEIGCKPLRQMGPLVPAGRGDGIVFVSTDDALQPTVGRPRPQTSVGTVTASHGEVRSTAAAKPAWLHAPSRRWMAAIGCAALVGALPLLRRTAAPAAKAAEAHVATSAAPAAAYPSSTPAPATALPPVHLHIGGTAGAEVLVDGRLVGEVPLEVDLPRVASERQVLVQRDGFVSWTRAIAGDTWVSATATLRKKPLGRRADPTGIVNPFNRSRR
jgi:serine/threonine-protein kinase